MPTRTLTATEQQLLAETCLEMALDAVRSLHVEWIDRPDNPKNHQLARLMMALQRSLEMLQSLGPSSEGATR